jgi:hypothetical protein
MAQIQTYPRKTTYDVNDLILICDKTPDANGVVTNDTKTTTISTIADNLNVVETLNSLKGNLIINGSTGISVGASSSTISLTNTGVTSLAATLPIQVSGSTGSVTISSRAYSGSTTTGYVPEGGSGTTFLRGDGSWATPSGGGDTYTLQAETKSGGANLLLNAATGSDSTVSLTQGSGITITRDSSTSVSISSSGNSSGFQTIPLSNSDAFVTAAGTFVFQSIVGASLSENVFFKVFNLLQLASERDVIVGIFKGSLSAPSSATLHSTGSLSGVVAAKTFSAIEMAKADGATNLVVGEPIVVCVSLEENISVPGTTTAISNEFFGLFSSSVATTFETLSGLLSSFTFNPTGTRISALLYN